MIRSVKPKNRRAKRALEEKAAKVHENTKTAMFLRGLRTSESVSGFMKDCSLIKKPFCASLNRRNDIRPFEDVTPLEFLSDKNDSSLFMVGTHNKKRPNNLVIGRMFDHHILDMMELSVDKYQSMQSFLEERKGTKNEKRTHMLGSKPMLVFQGDKFESDPTFKMVKNLFLDFFRGQDATNINLAGLDHVIIISSVGETIIFGHYHVKFKRAGGSTPRVELLEIGPHAEMSIRRTQWASDDLRKAAYKTAWQPKQAKNIESSMGDRLGRIHVPRQELSTIRVRRVKALRKRKGEGKPEQSGAASSSAAVEPREEPTAKRSRRSEE